MFRFVQRTENKFEKKTTTAKTEQRNWRDWRQCFISLLLLSFLGRSLCRSSNFALIPPYILFNTIRRLAAASQLTNVACDGRTFKMNCDICAQLTVVVIHIEY